VPVGILAPGPVTPIGGPGGELPLLFGGESLARPRRVRFGIVVADIDDRMMFQSGGYATAGEMLQEIQPIGRPVAASRKEARVLAIRYREAIDPERLHSHLPIDRRLSRQDRK